MKKDKLYWSMEALKWVFFGVIPILIFIFKCTTITGQNGGVKFMIGCSSYIVLLLLFFIIKKTLLKNYIRDLSGKIVNYTTQLETETDQSKIPLIEKALSKCLLARSIFTVIPVLLVIGIVILVVNALEKDLITLYSVLGLIGLSIIFGMVAMVVQETNIKSKNRDGGLNGTEADKNTEN